MATFPPSNTPTRAPSSATCLRPITYTVSRFTLSSRYSCFPSYMVPAFSKSLSYYQQTTHLPKRRAGHGLPFRSRWLFNGSVLAANEWYEGYAFASLHSGLAFLVRRVHYRTFCIGTHVLLQDSWHGVYPRWHVSFNITMLRLVSFGIDHHWACNHIGIADV